LSAKIRRGKMGKISCRNFLKGTAAGAVGMTATGLSGVVLPTAAKASAERNERKTRYCEGYDNVAGIGIESAEVAHTLFLRFTLSIAAAMHLTMYSAALSVC
jgi:hypothetical protein